MFIIPVLVKYLVYMKVQKGKEKEKSHGEPIMKVLEHQCDTDEFQSPVNPPLEKKRKEKKKKRDAIKTDQKNAKILLTRPNGS